MVLQAWLVCVSESAKNNGELLKIEAIFRCTKRYSMTFFVEKCPYLLTESLV
jgi:hypothetical protein